MASDTLPYRGRTRGSYAVLIYSGTQQGRAGQMAMARAYTAMVFSSVDACDEEEESDFSPIQSTSESSLAFDLEDQFESAIEEYSGLVTDPPRQLRMVSSTRTRAARMDPWKAKNGRRIRLIKKKNREGLSDPERAELTRLKAEVRQHVHEVAPRSMEALEEFEDFVSKMRAEVVAKKGQKP